MAELVEHRVHPVGVGPDVGENPHVVRVLASDAGAEGVLALALPLVEIAPGDHTPHVQPQTVEGPAGQVLEVLTLEVAVQVDAGNVGSPVEERARKVPRHDLVYAELPLSASVSISLLSSLNGASVADSSLAMIPASSPASIS